MIFKQVQIGCDIFKIYRNHGINLRERRSVIFVSTELRRISSTAVIHFAKYNVSRSKELGTSSELSSLSIMLNLTRSPEESMSGDNKD
jgi:hypothetical protein